MFIPKFSKNILTLFGIMICDVASTRAAFPILALVFFDTHSHIFVSHTEHDVRSYWYAACIALPNIASFIATPIICSLSDRYGRKPLLIISLFGVMLASFVAGLAVLIGSLLWLIIGVMFSGIFTHSNPIAQAVVGDTETEKKKVLTMGWLQCFIAIGAFIGPIFGGHIARWEFSTMNFSPAFFLSSLFGFLGLILCAFVFKETLAQKNKTSSYVLILKCFGLFRHKAILLLSSILFFSQITWSMFYQYISPLLKIRLQYDSGSIGLFVGLIALWLVFSSSYGLSFIKKIFNLQQCIFAGLCLELLGAALAIIGLYFYCSPIVWASALPIAAGDVVVFSAISTLYSNIVCRQQQGQVMGLCYLVRMSAWTLTSFLGGMLMAIHLQLPLWIAPIGVVLAIIVCLSAFSFSLKNA